ncbi:hypothetical protein [Uliginosibacterium gangwonense]|uniref:hypothetical protein n=1 Tax=Uliginosibacterium gangwonense TaxID=392736 RepID=UPI00037CFB27|nr:hypothetical protein [Uliginosibacterium gangwonense]
MFSVPSVLSVASSRRRFMYAGLAIVASPVLSAAPVATPKETNGGPPLQVEYILLANQRRTLVQRIAKLYAQAVVGARVSDAKRVISDSVKRFDALQQAHLDAYQRSGTPNYQIESTLQRIGSDWIKFRALVSAQPSLANLPALANQCTSLSSLINQSAGPTSLFLSGSPLGQLVDYSGKQCLLSQLIAKCYFFRALGYQGEEASRQIAEASKEFAENAQLLAKAPENTGEIKSLLLLAQTQWPYFEEAVSKLERKDAAQFDYNVATTAENIYEVLDRTNLLYYKLM